MVTESFHSSLFWSECSENSPTALLGCLYFYDFSTKYIAFFHWPGFWGHRLGYDVHKCSWQQATEDVGARSFGSSVTDGSCWGFDLMNQLHLSKLLRFLLPRNCYLCLCSKTGQRMCSRHWPLTCFEGERLPGVLQKKRAFLLDVSVVPSPRRDVPLTWQRQSSFEKLFLTQHSCSRLGFSKWHRFCRLSPNTPREMMTTQVCDFDEWTKSDHVSRVSQKSPIGHSIMFCLLFAGLMQALKCKNPKRV